MHKNALTVNASIVTHLTHGLHLAQQQYKSVYKMDWSQQMAPPSHQYQNHTQSPLLPRKSLGKQIGMMPKYIHGDYIWFCMYVHI